MQADRSADAVVAGSLEHMAHELKSEPREVSCVVSQCQLKTMQNIIAGFLQENAEGKCTEIVLGWTFCGWTSLLIVGCLYKVSCTTSGVVQKALVKMENITDTCCEDG